MCSLGRFFGFIGHGLKQNFDRSQSGPRLTSEPTVSPGQAAVGVTERAMRGTWTAQGGGVVTVVREFLVNDMQLVPGEAATPEVSEFGKRLVYRETATEKGGSADGTKTVDVVIGFVSATVATVETAPTITPANGAPGTTFTITPTIWTGTTPITSTGILTLDGQDVSQDMVGMNYTPTAGGELVWSETANNVAGTGATVSVAVSVSTNQTTPRLMEDGTPRLLEDGTPRILE